MDKRKHADHYHIHVGLPGYLPNISFSCETLAEAGNIAHEEAEAFRDAGYCAAFGKDRLGRVTGSKRDGYDVERQYFWDSHSRSRWDVWQTITIQHCNDADCRCVMCHHLYVIEDATCPNCLHTY